MITAIVVIVTIATFAATEPAPFTKCNDYLKNVSSRNIQVDVSGCSGLQGRCPLWLGTSHNFTVRFIPETRLTGKLGIERQITAKFPDKIQGRNVEIPYGPAVLANNNTFRVSTGIPISKADNELVPNELYLHNSIFPVVAGAPKVNLTVRYMIREKKAGGGARRRPDWRNHPGPIFACIEIPVEITDP